MAGYQKFIFSHMKPYDRPGTLSTTSGQMLFRFEMEKRAGTLLADDVVLLAPDGQSLATWEKHEWSSDKVRLGPYLGGMTVKEKDLVSKKSAFVDPRTGVQFTWKGRECLDPAGLAVARVKHGKEHMFSDDEHPEIEILQTHLGLADLLVLSCIILFRRAKEQSGGALQNISDGYDAGQNISSIVTALS